MNDPFSTTYEGSRQALGTIGTGIQQTAGAFAQNIQKQRMQKQTMDMLQQMGILTPKAVSLKDYEDIAKQQGVDIISGQKEDVQGIGMPTTGPRTQLDDIKKMQIADTIFTQLGIPKPQSKGMNWDWDKAQKAGLEFNPTTGEAVIKPKEPKGISITDASDLTSEQQLQGRALARKIYGVRGAEYGLPAVYNEMRKGKSVDDIEDNLRYAGQSKEFVGPVREAAQNIMIGQDATKSQNAMDYIDDAISRGDTEGTKSYLKRLAVKQAGVEDVRSVYGKERTIKLLDEIQGDLDNYEKMGGDTNIFTGTAEQVAAKAGAVINPEIRKIATKISAAVQNYRRSMTGVQFGMPENEEYKMMFPTISRTSEFNSANISGLKEVMKGDLDNFYALSMGEENYNKLFKESTKGSKLQSQSAKTTSSFDPKTQKKQVNKKTGEIRIVPR